MAAALAAGCDTLWSEDLQDGMLVDGRMRITNPFQAPGVWTSPLTSARRHGSLPAMSTPVRNSRRWWRTS